MSDDKERGLYEKYNVERKDGRVVDACIVLEFKDPNARVGIAAWSAQVRKEGYIKLADEVDQDLKNWGYVTPPTLEQRQVEALEGIANGIYDALQFAMRRF